MNELKQKRYQTHDNRANRNFRNNPKNSSSSFFIWRLTFSRFCCVRYSIFHYVHIHTRSYTIWIAYTYTIYAYRNFNACIAVDEKYELAFPWSGFFSSFVRFSFSSWISDWFRITFRIWYSIELRIWFLFSCFRLSDQMCMCLWYVNLIVG